MLRKRLARALALFLPGIFLLGFNIGTGGNIIFIQRRSESSSRCLIFPRNSGHQVKSYIMIQDEVFYEQTQKVPESE